MEAIGYNDVGFPAWLDEKNAITLKGHLTLFSWRKGLVLRPLQNRTLRCPPRPFAGALQGPTAGLCLPIEPKI